MTEPDLLAEIDVGAPVTRVWAAVGDPARMARWSPEGVLVRVIGAPRVGARTVNVNRRGFAVWPTSSTIVRYEPEREIAWSVRASGTVWSLELSPTPAGGTHLVNRRTVPGARPLVARLFAPLVGGVEGHDAALAAGMHRTLAAIKADLERPDSV
ncbi:SRPBCC family protein [Jatrophihabitans sp. YIM 134969]